jgi:conjugative transfer signal peptidase TraF
MSRFTSWRSAAMMAAVLLAIGLLTATRLIVNVTPSVPVGLYWSHHRAPVRGDFVLTSLPSRLRDLAAGRDYLRHDHLLLKKVAAMDGDRVCRRGRAVWINGHIHVWARRNDALGRALPVWFGCRELTGDELFILGTHPSSFDSRYFGSILCSDVIAVANPLWVWRAD